MRGIAQALFFPRIGEEAERVASMSLRGKCDIVGDSEVDLLRLRLGGVLPQVRPERFDQFLLVLDQQCPQPPQLLDAPVQWAGDAGVD